ncbi:MAG: undecaprenyl-diphosphatase UppP [Candidatus Goldbacteria bacterium]|nr:undecaprenyl-diphosphatase UppP [Candidatus Goldiibacteriota bacterium]
MDIIHSFLLGIVQGLTEFLPISSSAHLVLVPKILKTKSELLNSLTFDVVLHAGTLMAVLIYYLKKIKNLTIAFFNGIFDVEKRKILDFKLSFFLLVATIPAFLAGYFFNEYAENTFRSPLLIAIIFILFALFLLFADKKKGLFKDIEHITLKEAIIIGCFQALAIIPGVSRSGITITAALLLGFKRDSSAEFSFLLSVPVIFGAFIFKIKDAFKLVTNDNFLIFLVGFVSSFIAGFIAIFFLINFVKKNSYLPFVVYRILLGGVIIFLFFKGII